MTEPAEEQNPFKPGTMAHQLWVATKAMQRIEPRPKRQPSDNPRKRVVAVRLKDGGESNPQKGSKRRAILNWLATRPETTATIVELQEHFNEPMRGHVQKLIEKKHLHPIEEKVTKQ